MTPDRKGMTGRVVPLTSDAAADGRVGGTVEERLALVTTLSRRAWALARRPVPAYTRRTIPFRLTTLDEQ